MVNLYECAYPNTIDFMKTLKSIQTLGRGKLRSNNLIKVTSRQKKEKSMFTVVRGRLQEDGEN